MVYPYSLSSQRCHCKRLYKGEPNKIFNDALLLKYSQLFILSRLQYMPILPCFYYSARVIHDLKLKLSHAQMKITLSHAFSLKGASGLKVPQLNGFF